MGLDPDRDPDAAACLISPCLRGSKKYSFIPLHGGSDLKACRVVVSSFAKIGGKIIVPDQAPHSFSEGTYVPDWYEQTVFSIL